MAFLFNLPDFNLAHMPVGAVLPPDVECVDCPVEYVIALRQRPTTGAVPEPSIIALFAAGLFGIGFARRRKA